MDKFTVDFVIPEFVYDAFRIKCKAIVDEVFNEKLKSIQQERRKCTRSETAKMLRISLVTLDKLKREGILKSQTIGKRVLFCESEIEQYLNRGR